jgi:Glycosyl hydrolase family 79 C-terminal beta domain
MDGPFRRRYFVTDVVLVAAVVVAIVVLGLTSSRSGGASGPAVAATVDRDATGRVIPAGFLGLSFEYPSLESYAGDDPLAINPVFEQLVRNLAPGQAPMLRIGGDSSDSTWWPISGMAQPPGVTFSLSQRWVQVTRALSAALGAKLILGINLEAGSPELAAVEASSLVNGIGSSSVRALELGNEPELYGSFAWYHTPNGRSVTGRPPGYDFTAFRSDFTGSANALPPVPLAGPAFGDFAWVTHLNEFLAAEPRVSLVTLHRYPLQRCFVSRRSPSYPTISHLLSAAASTGLADHFAHYAATARTRGHPLRIDELNTVSCGADPKISNTFASALWALDTLFEMARVGVEGVNIHTFPGAGYDMFTFSRADGRWRASVAPEYYGLLMFAQAAPLGSRLLAVSGATKNPIKIWATLGPDRWIRVVVINKDLHRARAVALGVPSVRGAATVERLQAASVRASTGVTLGDQSFGSETETGMLPGSSHAVSLRPINGTYTVRLPAASAALLALAPERR